MALQFTPPPLISFVPRLLQEAYFSPSPSPSRLPDYSPPVPSQTWLPPSLSPSLSPSPSPSSLIYGFGGLDESEPPPVGLIAGLTVAGAGIVVAALFIFWCCWRRKRRTKENFDLNSKEHFDGEPPVLQISPEDGHSGFMSSYPSPLERNGSGSKKPPPPQSPGIALGLSKSVFTYEDLAQATDNFSPSNLLGEGGFGYVHKGVLPNGKMVAIKQLKAGSRQGEREFQAEVEVINGRIHHRHLVSLVGYCISGARRMLVYEFVPNNTLEFHLHGAERSAMNWPTRMKIALGSAKGLAYLHEECHPKVIHRDIKAANILLDHAFEAKVADFGLAKFFSDTDTHLSTRIMGTFGYLAPEYAYSGKLTEKSDVFSFGVVLLELITGRRPIYKIHSSADDESLVEWARPLLMQALDKGNFNGLVDPNLENDYNYSEVVTRMVACAAACVRHSAHLRPRMSQILRALEGIIPLQDLNAGIKPGHSHPSNSPTSSEVSTTLTSSTEIPEIIIL